MNQDQFLFLDLLGEVREEYISQSSQPWEERRRPHIYHLGRKIACLALIVTLGFCLAFYDQVYAAIKRFTTMIGESLGLTKDLTPYTEIVGQTQTQGDISLTLNEVILDEHRLFASFDAACGDRKAVPQFRINGKRTRINGISYPYEESVFTLGGGSELIEENGMDNSIVLGLNYADLELPKGEVIVHLVVNAEEYLVTDTEVWSADFKNYEETDFVFDFVLSDEELLEQTVKRTLDIDIFDGEDKMLTLTDLTMNDLYCILVAKKHFSWDDPWIEGCEIKLMGEDSLGNPVALPMGGFFDDEICFETSYAGDGEAGIIADEENPDRPMIPDKNCTYMDLQFYKRQILWDDLDLSGGDAFAEYENPYEGLENNGWEPVGKKIRVMMNE